MTYFSSLQDTRLIPHIPSAIGAALMQGYLCDQKGERTSGNRASIRELPRLHKYTYAILLHRHLSYPDGRNYFSLSKFSSTASIFHFVYLHLHTKPQKSKCYTRNRRMQVSSFSQILARFLHPYSWQLRYSLLIIERGGNECTDGAGGPIHNILQGILIVRKHNIYSCRYRVEFVHSG